MKLHLMPDDNKRLSALPELLLPWFRKHARSMPWRETPNPYYTWVSEIMLQQTRVEAATGYFLRFVEALPTVIDLAAVPDEELMKLWEGLGYYSRARNLKKAAKQLCREYNGALPADYDTLLTLPGIGSYTAGAIASIAFGLPHPAVDGNVLRVVSRVTECRDNISDAAVKKAWEQELTNILPKEVGDFNQSLMEIGALICLPNGAPRCLECPLADICKGFQNGTAMELPVKAAKKARRKEDLTVFLLISPGGKVALRKRPEEGLLAGLWELPNHTGALKKEDVEAYFSENDIPAEIEKITTAKHIFSHVEWNMSGFLVRLKEIAPPDPSLVWVSREELKRQYSLPSAFKVYRQILGDVLYFE